jgi:hypothetical protein
VLERDVEKGATRLGEHLSVRAQGSFDVDPAPATLRHPGGDVELSVDQDRPAPAHEDPRGHDGKPVPGGEEPARLVQGRTDEAAVDDSGPALVALAEEEGRLVALTPLLGRKREMDAVRIVAAPPTRRIVVRRYALYRRPPRSKWAR